MMLTIVISVSYCKSRISPRHLYSMPQSFQILLAQCLYYSVNKTEQSIVFILHNLFWLIVPAMVTQQHTPNEPAAMYPEMFSIYIQHNTGSHMCQPLIHSENS